MAILPTQFVLLREKFLRFIETLKQTGLMQSLPYILSVSLTRQPSHHRLPIENNQHAKKL
jgi:hypothetical protein